VQMEKYVGRTVEIVYLAQNGQLTQRFIQVRRISGGTVFAQCLTSCGPRTFRSERILAVMPVIRRTG
jgi:hypothetical protein